jgi:hypothetical protein
MLNYIKIRRHPLLLNGTSKNREKEGMAPERWVGLRVLGTRFVHPQSWSNEFVTPPDDVHPLRLRY